MKEVIDTVSVALANGDTENVGNVVMQEVNRTLLSAGVDEVWADKIDNLIVLLFIIGIALRSINAAKSPETSAALVSTLPLYTSPVVPFREMKSPSFNVIPSISTVRVL